MGKVIIEEIQCKSLINQIHGSALSFQWTINPYWSCQYISLLSFARDTHSHLGMATGRDFGTRASVKTNVPEVLQQELRSPTWRG